MDMSDFAESFYDEAEELLADMEQQLLELDIDDPDAEQLNAIFRAAHSIKGGAGAFGFMVLQETTHVLENLLDDARRRQLTLSREIVDTFLRAKDVLTDQLTAYRQSEEPDQRSFAAICEQLRRFGSDNEAAPAPAAQAPNNEANSNEAPLDRIARVLHQIARECQPEITASAAGTVQETAVSGQSEDGGASAAHLKISLLEVGEDDRQLLLEELKHFGELLSSEGDEQCFDVMIQTTTSPDDISAVMCFIIEQDQIAIAPVEAGAQQESAKSSAASTQREDKPKAVSDSRKPAKNATESASIRVTVDKVDQIINLVGELVITQSMLDQTVEALQASKKGGLISGLAQLKRNARDLQEAVMSIRMLPMDYVFSRFPRQVRDLATKLGKEVELMTEGSSAELDKGLIERIIDPLTHLVRNSLDHGIEKSEVRLAAGKPAAGQLLLSARHQGGNIVIEVADDGAGLNREKLLTKAKSNGLNVSDSMSDEEVWQLIFAPGFSTAEVVSDVSGRGVGMDVVKRNIQSMGGHVEIMSAAGQGTTTRVVLPLTLAILDGMSVRVGREMFVLPLAAISELVQPNRKNIFTMAKDDVLLKVRDDYLPVVALHEVMSVPGAQNDMTKTIAVIIQGEDRQYALLVDEPVGQQQIVVKNMEANYRKVPGVSAATILGDGRVALILDPAGLYRRNQNRKKSKSASARQKAGQSQFAFEE